MFVLCPYEHIMSIRGLRNPKTSGSREFRDGICSPVYVRLWISFPAQRFPASPPTLHSEFRDALTSPLTFLQYETVYEYRIEECFQNPFQQAGKSVRDRTGPNFVTDYAPVPVRTLRNHSPAHVFWVSQPKLDTEFRDGRSSVAYVQLWISLPLQRFLPSRPCYHCGCPRFRVFLSLYFGPKNWVLKFTCNNCHAMVHSSAVDNLSRQDSHVRGKRRYTIPHQPLNIYTTGVLFR